MLFHRFDRGIQIKNIASSTEVIELSSDEDEVSVSACYLTSKLEPQYLSQNFC